MSPPRVTETYTGAATGVVVGAVLWSLTTYVFKSGTPAPLQALVWLAVPGITGAVRGFIVRREAKQPEPAPAPAPAKP